MAAGNYPSRANHSESVVLRQVHVALSLASGATRRVVVELSGERRLQVLPSTRRTLGRLYFCRAVARQSIPTTGRCRSGWMPMSPAIPSACSPGPTSRPGSSPAPLAGRFVRAPTRGAGHGPEAPPRTVAKHHLGGLLGVARPQLHQDCVQPPPKTPHTTRSGRGYRPCRRADAVLGGRTACTSGWGWRGRSTIRTATLRSDDSCFGRGGADSRGRLCRTAGQRVITDLIAAVAATVDDRPGYARGMCDHDLKHPQALRLSPTPRVISHGEEAKS
jgi:hypothetical protein